MEDAYSYSFKDELINLASNSTMLGGSNTYMNTCYTTSDCTSGLTCCWGNFYTYNPTYQYSYYGYQEACNYSSSCGTDPVTALVWMYWLIWACIIGCVVCCVVSCVRRRRVYYVQQNNPNPQVTVVSTNTTNVAPAVYSQPPQPQYGYQPAPQYPPQPQGYYPPPPPQYGQYGPGQQY